MSPTTATVPYDVSNGGTCTDLRIVMAGGSGRNGESVCQPSPNTILEGSSASLMSGCTLRWPGTPLVYEPGLEHLEGGDVLLLAPGVVAVGTGERTTPAGVERLARRLLAARLVHTVLAVPVLQERATMHLDTVCTMVDTDAVVMYPNIAHELTALAVTASEDDGAAGDLDVSAPQPFLVAAAAAMGIDELRVIDTGLDPVTAEREQWDDGNNTLALAPRVAVAYERNTETNARLEAAGIEVVAVAGSELGSGRGGPRCMSCPVSRDPL